MRPSVNIYIRFIAENGVEGHYFAQIAKKVAAGLKVRWFLDTGDDPKILKLDESKFNCFILFICLLF